MTSPGGLTPEDFKRLPRDGERFETLVSQLLKAMGCRIIEKPAIGTEGGRDVLVDRILSDPIIGERSERVVVQCKHYAHSGRPVRDSNVGVWQNAMTRHKAQGYLLVTSTRVTENLSWSFREFTEENRPHKWAMFWDIDELIQHLNQHPDVRDTFFPLPPRPLFPQSVAEEVAGFLEARGYKILSGTFSGNYVEFRAQRTAEGTDVDRWYLCLQRRISSGDVEKLQGRIDDTPGTTGWIVTSNIIDSGFRQRLEADPTITISAYSVAEFYCEMLQYNHYLKDLIKTSQEEIDRYWVDLECSLDGENRFKLVEYVDEWLSDPERDQLALSGDFGTGKTWFCRYYAAKLARQHLKNPDYHRIPILVSLRGYTKAFGIEQLITDTLVNTHHIDLAGGFDTFKHLNRCGRLLLIFDGFDEMEQRVGYDVALRNYGEISRTVFEASKVILTSRPLFFAVAEEVLEASFEILSLQVFGDEQIKEVLQKRVPHKWKQCWTQISEIEQLRDLTWRPVMTQIISETLPAIVEAGHFDSATLYETYYDTYIDEWIKKAWKTRTGQPPREKVRQFVRDLAWDMFQSPTVEAISQSELHERIQAKLGAETVARGLEHLFVLDRATGNYTFPHITFVEYFVADKVAEGLNEGDPEPLFNCTLTDGVKEFLVHLLRSKRSKSGAQAGILKAVLSAKPGIQTNTMTELLLRLGEGNPIKPIIGALTSTEQTLEEFPQDVVAALGKQEFLNEVIKQLGEDVGSHVRIFLLELLGSPAIDPDRAIEELTAVMYKDPDPQVRLHAVEVLGKRRGEKETQTLIEAVGSQRLPARTRQACLNSIQVSSLKNASIRRESLNVIHQTIADDQDNVEARQHCVIKLKEYGSREALEPLLAILKDFNHVLWHVAAITISQTRDPTLADDIDREIILPNEDDPSLLRQIAFLKAIVESIGEKAQA
jgi:HEAT repeat protein